MVGVQLNDVIAFAATEEDDIISQIMDIGEYAEYDLYKK